MRKSCGALVFFLAGWSLSALLVAAMTKSIEHVALLSLMALFFYWSGAFARAHAHVTPRSEPSLTSLLGSLIARALTRVAQSARRTE